MSTDKLTRRRQIMRSDVVEPRTLAICFVGSLVLAALAYAGFANLVLPLGIEIALRVLVFLAYATLSAVLVMSAITLYGLKLSRRHQHRVESSMTVANRLALAIEMRDVCTPGHNDRIGQYSRIIAEEMGLDDDFAEMMQFAAPLHDVGKIGVPDRILNKPGPLTDAERDVIEQHVELGAKILSGSDDPFLQLAHSIVLTHHEAWDGSGYPRGLKGTEIPIEGRIASVCDVFDALMSHRPYKEPWPVGRALDEIQRLKGTRFDPDVVEAFERSVHRLIQVNREPLKPDFAALSDSESARPTDDLQTA